MVQQLPKCAHCKQPYTRTHNGIETWCSVDCGYALARAKQAKQFKAETAVMKKAIKDKDRAYWQKRAQTAFNAWIRKRDAGLPCISCGVPDGKGKRNAGHYRPAHVNAALRFSEINCHGQCEACNTSLSGNLINYRKGLVLKIGLEAVECLENCNTIQRWTIEEFKNIEIDYKARLR